jgi:hypothetical protein
MKRIVLFFSGQITVSKSKSFEKSTRNTLNTSLPLASTGNPTQSNLHAGRLDICEGRLRQPRRGTRGVIREGNLTSQSTALVHRCQQENVFEQ